MPHTVYNTSRPNHTEGSDWPCHVVEARGLVGILYLDCVYAYINNLAG